MPAQDATSPGMPSGLARSEAQAHAGLGSAEGVQRALRRAEEHYARTQEASAPKHIFTTISQISSRR